MRRGDPDALLAVLKSRADATAAQLARATFGGTGKPRTSERTRANAAIRVLRDRGVVEVSRTELRSSYTQVWYRVRK